MSPLRYTYLLLLYLVSVNVYAIPMKRLLPILLACLCLVACHKTAIKDKTLQELVKAGRDKGLTIVEFYERGDSVLMAVTLDAPYIPHRRMVGYEIQRNLRYLNHVVFLSALKHQTLPTFIVDTTQLQMLPDSTVQYYLGEHFVLGWGDLLVYKIENDSLIYCYTELIE